MPITVQLMGKVDVLVARDQNGNPLRIIQVDTGQGVYGIPLDPIAAATVSRALSPPQGQAENGSVVALSPPGSAA